MTLRTTIALTLCLALACSLSAAATPLPGGAPAASAAMDKLLSATFQAGDPGCAALVVRRGQTLLRKGYGMADLELGAPVEPTHVFRIGSMTKQFTAVAILQLAKAGKLRLDDEIGAFAPDYPVGDSKVTLSQLLSHTAGIPSIEAQPAWLKAWRQDMTLPQLLAFTKGKPLDFAPGTDWKYSNTGYFLLGAVIEKASGESYAHYVETHLFAPAGMSHSAYGSESRVIPQRIPGYSREGETWVNAPYISMSQPYSAGGLLSTVDDLRSWEQALAAGKLVSPALLAQAYADHQLPDGRMAGYGFGWQIGAIGKHPSIEHGGGIQGFASHELRIADAGVYVAILCNTDHPPTSLRPLAASLARLAMGETEPTAAPKPDSPLVLEDYAGTYRVSPTVNLGIVVENGKLIGQLGPGQRPLTATAIDEFSTPGNEMRLTFLRDAARRVDRVSVRGDGPGPSQIWPRIEGAAK